MKKIAADSKIAPGNNLRQFKMVTNCTKIPLLKFHGL
jgi:hypothetical protein